MKSVQYCIFYFIYTVFNALNADTATVPSLSVWTGFDYTFVWHNAYAIYSQSLRNIFFIFLSNKPS